MPVEDAYVPGGHKTQAEVDLAPTSLEKVPVGQGEQLVDPVVALKDPEGQATHVEDEKAPTALENVPVGHKTQLEDPRLEE